MKTETELKLTEVIKRTIKRVKLFEYSDIMKLEGNVNKWLEENEDVDIIDIKYNTIFISTEKEAPYDTYSQENCLILYSKQII